MSASKRTPGQGAPHGAPSGAPRTARDRILRPRRETRLEQAQREAVTRIRAELEAENLLDLITDPDSTVLGYLRMSKAIGTDAHGVARDAVRQAIKAKEEGKAFRPDPETGLPFFVDNSISAANNGRDDNKRPRPSYERLVAEVETGTVTEVMSPNLDRLHRDPMELEAFILLAIRQREYGTPFRFTELSSSIMDLNTADGQGNARLLASMAAREVAKTRERLMADNEARRRDRGWGSAMIPLGFKALRDPATDRKLFPFIEPHPVWGPVIRDSAEDYATDRATLADLAARWEALGVPRSGRAELGWDSRLVGQALRRHAIAGIQTYRRQGRDRDGKRWPVEVLGDGAWEALVSKRTFRTIEAKTVRNAARYRATGRAPGPYTRLFRCAGCGGWLYRANRSDRGTWSWTCLTAREGCGKVSVSGPDAEAWARAHAAGELHRQRIEADAAALTDDGDVARLSAELSALDAHIEENKALYRARRIRPDTYADTDTELHRDKDALTAQLDAAEGKAVDLTHQWVTPEGDLLADLEELAAHNPADLTRALHLAYPQGIRVTLAGGRRLPAEERLSAWDDDQ